MYVATIAGEVLTEIDRSNVYPIIIIPSTGLSELPSPERLCGVDSKPKGFEIMSDRRRLVHRDN
jgi:hypothetical protein